MEGKEEQPPPYTQQPTADHQPSHPYAPQQYPYNPQGQQPYPGQPQGQQPYPGQPQGQQPYPGQPQGQQPYPGQPPAGYMQYPTGQPGGTYNLQPGGAYTGQPWTPHQGAQPQLGQQVVSQQVVVMNRPMVNDWKHDLCGCFDDIEATCLAYWVPCVQYGLNAEAVGHDCCAYGCMFLLAASFGVPCVAGMILREEIRRKRGIEGDSCNDCLIWTFLGCCALVQEAQELKEAQREPQIQEINRT